MGNSLVVPPKLNIGPLQQPACSPSRYLLPAVENTTSDRCSHTPVHRSISRSSRTAETTQVVLSRWTDARSMVPTQGGVFSRTDCRLWDRPRCGRTLNARGWARYALSTRKDKCCFHSSDASKIGKFPGTESETGIAWGWRAMGTGCRCVQRFCLGW